MDSEVASRKIFIGGLSYGTDDDKLRQYFEQFGPVHDAVVMKDPFSRRSRGFGFITFEHASYVDNALLQESHTIDSRKVEAKRAVPRNDTIPPPKPPSTHPPPSSSGPSHPNLSNGNSDEYAYSKIFVGGLHYDTRDGDFRTYFEKYGKVLSAEVMFNRETHKSRGFGFIVFESESAVDGVCAEREHYIDGKLVEVKRAVPRSKIGINTAPIPSIPSLATVTPTKSVPVTASSTVQSTPPPTAAGNGAGAITASKSMNNNINDPKKTSPALIGQGSVTGLLSTTSNSSSVVTATGGGKPSSSTQPSSNNSATHKQPTSTTSISLPSTSKGSGPANALPPSLVRGTGGNAPSTSYAAALKSGQSQGHQRSTGTGIPPPPLPPPPSPPPSSSLAVISSASSTPRNPTDNPVAATPPFYLGSSGQNGATAMAMTMAGESLLSGSGKVESIVSPPRPYQQTPPATQQQQSTPRSTSQPSPIGSPLQTASDSTTRPLVSSSSSTPTHSIPSASGSYGYPPLPPSSSSSSIGVVTGTETAKISAPSTPIHIALLQHEEQFPLPSPTLSLPSSIQPNSQSLNNSSSSGISNNINHSSVNSNSSVGLSHIGINNAMTPAAASLASQRHRAHSESYLLMQQHAKSPFNGLHTLPPPPSLSSLHSALPTAVNFMGSLSQGNNGSEGDGARSLHGQMHASLAQPSPPLGFYEGFHSAGMQFTEQSQQHSSLHSPHVLSGQQQQQQQPSLQLHPPPRYPTHNLTQGQRNANASSHQTIGSGISVTNANNSPNLLPSSSTNNHFGVNSSDALNWSSEPTPYRSEVERSISLGGLGWMPSSLSSPPPPRRGFSDLGLGISFSPLDHQGGADNGGTSVFGLGVGLGAVTSPSNDLHMPLTAAPPVPSASAWATIVDINSGMSFQSHQQLHTAQQQQQQLQQNHQLHLHQMQQQQQIHHQQLQGHHMQYQPASAPPPPQQQMGYPSPGHRQHSYSLGSHGSYGEGSIDSGLGGLYSGSGSILHQHASGGSIMSNGNINVGHQHQGQGHPPSNPHHLQQHHHLQQQHQQQVASDYYYSVPLSTGQVNGRVGEVAGGEADSYGLQELRLQASEFIPNGSNGGAWGVGGR